ncbi:Uncharacterized protein HZ326_1642 [Fusarium oxysporum f. sp. albedinis]|nr:Uncharacterized protein HZ326_1642 [Fusarium oxysporum f. sp. albedinis]
MRSLSGAQHQRHTGSTIGTNPTNNFFPRGPSKAEKKRKKFRTGRVGPEGGKSKLTLKLMNVKERGGMFGREYASATVQTCEKRSSSEKRGREFFLVFMMHRKRSRDGWYQPSVLR